MTKITFSILFIFYLVTVKAQPSPKLVARKYFLTHQSWFSNPTLRTDTTITFIVKSVKDFASTSEIIYKFNSDKSFIRRTNISKPQEYTADGISGQYSGSWTLDIYGSTISLKFGKEKNYRATFQIVDISRDTLILKLLRSPGK